MNAGALMRTVAQAFEKGDLQPLYNAIDENIVWKSAPTSRADFRFGGEHHGHAGVREVMSILAAEYTFDRFSAKEVVAHGNVVWGLFDAEASYRARGNGTAPARKVRFEQAIRWRVRDDKVVEHQGFFDTAGLLAQQQAEP